MTDQKLVFASFFESIDDLRHICRLTESIRTFGEKCHDAPVWAYHPLDVDVVDGELLRQLHTLGIEKKTFSYPQEAAWLYYAAKPYAAAEAETDAEKAADILVFIDEDTIILDDPADFFLDPAVDLAYRPVMHNRSGVLYDAPPNDFWSRVYELHGITENMLFPMITPADDQKK